MRILEQSAQRRSQQGGIVLRALVFVVGVAAGWMAWPSVGPKLAGQAKPPSLTISARPRETATPGATFSPRPAPSSSSSSSLDRATNGVLVIPVRDGSGANREPLVLVPLGPEKARPPARLGADPGAVRREPADTTANLAKRPGPPVTVIPRPALDATPSADPAPSLRPTPMPISIPIPIPTRSATRSATTAAPAAVAGTTNGARTGTLAAAAGPARSGAGAGADRTLEYQVALVRNGFSPGSIDGVIGSQTRAAVRAFQQREGLPVSGQFDERTVSQLLGGGDGTVYTNYVVASEDLERLLPLSASWLGKSEQPRLDYESILELVAERTRTHPNLLKRLNPGLDWARVPAGTVLRTLTAVPPAPAGKASLLRIRLAERVLQVFDAETKLLAHFPCSIAQRVEKRPVGETLHVAVVAPDPNYTFDPAVFPESAEARTLGRKLILQPGPNNPVGAVWIGLDKPGYGIHGTPKPEEVGRTESHGCFRLANWNARDLLDLVSIGTPVEVLP